MSPLSPAPGEPVIQMTGALCKRRLFGKGILSNNETFCWLLISFIAKKEIWFGKPLTVFNKINKTFYKHYLPLQGENYIAYGALESKLNIYCESAMFTFG